MTAVGVRLRCEGVVNVRLPEIRGAGRGLLRHLYRVAAARHPQLRLATDPSYALANNRSLYRRVLERLLSSGRLEFRTLSTLQSPGEQDKVVVGLRHDIDLDLATALKLAKIESDLGLRATYYALHTADYYRRTGNRDPRARSLLLRIQDLGHEVGLHNDCLHDLITAGVPAEETLARELEWLRTGGLEISGTASHGSLHSYLAANYEIFTGLSVDDRDAFVDRAGRRHPLGSIDPAEHGLVYEANYALDATIVSKDVYDEAYAPHFTCPAPVTDMLRRDYAFQYGLFGPDRWIGVQSDPHSQAYMDTAAVVQRLINQTPGTRAVLDLHPIYCGRNLRRSALHRVHQIARGGA